MSKVKRITLTVEPDDTVWGFSELLAEMPDASEDDQIEAVIDLTCEDFMSMFEDSVWCVEFENNDELKDGDLIVGDMAYDE